ncbi:MAG: T9SS type A sorting domain-containing protein, partial [bacterium]|nr:T9SS type A sorting domain-containing protein [bacterium]
KFAYRVRYTDVDNNGPSFGPKVHIMIGGVPINLPSVGTSPYLMTQLNPNPYNTGRDYEFVPSLNVLRVASDDYTFYFEARDIYGATATGNPTEVQPGPVVYGGNLAPVIQKFSLSPEIGTPNGSYIFSAKYTDKNNDLPASDYPNVEVFLGTTSLASFTLTYISGTPASGCIYSGSVTLLAKGTYTYRFTAKDNPWVGSQSTVQSILYTGPIVTDFPELIQGTVSPKVALAGSYFLFSVVYKDADGEEPARAFPRVFLTKNGKPIFGSPIMMFYSKGDFFLGATYEYPIQLTEPGEYSFWFEAKDINGAKVLTEVATLTVLSLAPSLPVITQSPEVSIIACYNYPNPTYDGKTTIRVEFSGSTSATLEISIYDVAGELVVENLKQKGSGANYIEYPWNGRNGNGRSVANGVYFARCIVDDGTKKVARLIKIAMLR